MAAWPSHEPVVLDARASIVTAGQADSQADVTISYAGQLSAIRRWLGAWRGRRRLTAVH